MILDQRTHDLLSAIDAILEARDNVQRIEREVRPHEEKGKIIEIFALQPTRSDLIPEIEKTAILARDEAQRLGFRVSPIRTAKDRRLCRQFTID